MLTGDGKILAGRYKRSVASEAWLLPAGTPDPEKWVRLALTHWRQMAPEIFPGVPLWSESETWSTTTEVSIRQEIAELDRKRTDYLAEIAAAEQSLRSRLRDAKACADEYERALLTSQSDELKFAVIRSLRELEFVVVDADQTAKDGDHLEDLHISVPDTPGWIALGEVKGYTKGAKTEALTQFLRFNARYMQENGRLPDSCWYIVNQFLGRDPSSRPLTLNGKDEDVNAFAGAGGLVLDTKELFTLLMQARDGSISLSKAREILRTTTGRFHAKLAY
ncbi:hypothetical protein LX86_006467 [Lentzea aerocolonigenes]|nr:hypothetical protein [Lentzea aerocolonigenes]